TAMLGDEPEEAIRNGDEEDGLEERGVIEKGDEADFRPRIARRIADECEVVFVEDPAQVFEHEQHREDSDASRETHDCSLSEALCHPERRRARGIPSHAGRSSFLRGGFLAVSAARKDIESEKPRLRRAQWRAGPTAKPLPYR